MVMPSQNLFLIPLKFHNLLVGKNKIDLNLKNDRIFYK